MCEHIGWATRIRKSGSYEVERELGVMMLDLMVEHERFTIHRNN